MFEFASIVPSPKRNSLLARYEDNGRREIGDLSGGLKFI